MLEGLWSAAWLFAWFVVGHLLYHATKSWWTRR